jgi:hypothetical protein
MLVLFSNLLLLVWAMKTCSAGIEVILKPNCRDCKWFVASNNQYYEPGRCSFHTNKIELPRADIVMQKYAIHCRLNDSLCGMNGINFEKKETNNTIELCKLQREIEEIETNFNGEICEKDEIKQLEEEIAKLKEKIEQYKKENKKLN